ncbi:nucleoside/nucleotide kinase family protein [Subtercola vilae]|uniref:Nucleoside/nucleotide kinase family protein n=1 Tax=Subtercola vilae TaxID=2056433 RepID=A0A4V4RDI8_9MICO|nr:nucleoside/nucleotide kinase family protein [Subtercola vilae]
MAPAEVAAERVTLEQVVADARRLAESGRRCILGFAGAPGAGKSTAAEHVVESLGSGLAALVPMDGFHLANDVLATLGRRARKGAPDTFDAAGYAALLQRIRSQSTPGDDAVVYAPRFDRGLDESIGSALAVLPEVPLIVTEGNYLLLESGAWPAARAFIDEVWFIEAPEIVRRERLIRRHESFGTSAEDARSWALGPDEQNATLVAASAPRADRRLIIV